MQRCGKYLGIGNCCCGVGFKVRTKRFAECYGLGSDGMHQWTALEAREDSRVDLLSDCLIIGHDHAPTGPTERFMGSIRDHMRMFKWVRMHAASN